METCSGWGGGDGRAGPGRDHRGLRRASRAAVKAGLRGLREVGSLSAPGGRQPGAGTYPSGRSTGRRFRDRWAGVHLLGECPSAPDGVCLLFCVKSWGGKPVILRTIKDPGPPPQTTFLENYRKQKCHALSIFIPDAGRLI